MNEQIAPDRDLRKWIGVCLWASLAIVMSVPLYLVKRTVVGQRNTVAEAEIATFVGRESCVSCHEEAFQAWIGSDHDMSMDYASDSTVLGDFDNSIFTLHGDSAEFFRRDGEYLIRTKSSGGDWVEQKIVYTFGVDPLQQYLIPFPGGRLQALSIAWDVSRERWYHLYPENRIPDSDWLHWSQGAQNWNGMCAECHTTNLVKGYDAGTKSFKTTWSEIDVSCEACHGPGSNHVAWAELSPMARSESENFELVVSTSDITARQQVELCAPCHSRRSELGDYDHRELELLDSQLPALLREGLYHPDGQILEEVYVYGSFVQSKMFHNDVACNECHDVHSLELIESGNDLCLQCHRADDYDSYEHHYHQKFVDGAPSEGSSCQKCHMMEQPYMGIDLRADHSIRTPRPDLSLEIDVPNACNQSGCHDDRSTSWAADYFYEWYGTAVKPHWGKIIAAGRRGDPDVHDDLVRLSGDELYPTIVRATALTLLALYPGDSTTQAVYLALVDEEPLLRYTALSALNPGIINEYSEAIVPLLFDPVKAIRIETASRLAGIPDQLLEQYQREALSQAIDEYVEAMTYSLDFPSSGYNLGNLFTRLGETSRAESFYRTAIDIDDLFFPAKVNLGVLLNSQGRNGEAETLFREVLAFDPLQYDCAYMLGLLLAEMNRLDEAVEFLGEASDGLPNNGRVHYNYGLALQATGQLANAESALLRALGVEPTNLDFLYALADHYVKRELWDRAIHISDELIKHHPESQLGFNLRTLIEQRR